MLKKSLIIGVVLGAFVLLGVGALLVFQERESKPNVPTTNDHATPATNELGSSSQEKDTSSQERDDTTTVFVTDVDLDVDHWQTKETEFFTIKFPKEWYWMESDLEKTGYHSEVITNNPHFAIDKYPDISVFTGDSYQMFSKDNSEIIITMNGLGEATSNSGTPREFMEGEIARLKKDYPEMKCHYTSSLTSVPLTAFCAFSDSNGEVVDTYYSSNITRTFAYTARLTQENGMRDSVEYILERIVKSRLQEKNF